MLVTPESAGYLSDIDPARSLRRAPRGRPILSVTIDPDLDRELRRRALARGVAVSRVASELLRTGLGLEVPQAPATATPNP